MTANNDILITGLPRAGTTLVCHLLNRLHNTVCLHEPMDVGRFKHARNETEILRQVEDFLRSSRQSLLEKGQATSKHLGGRVPDNPISDQKSESGLRKSVTPRGTVSFDKTLNGGFNLLVKHNAAYAALLPLLKHHYRCHAIVRNPLSVLGSWNTVDIPVRTGHAPAAENIDKSLADALGVLDDARERQFHLLAWYYGRYVEHLESDSVIRYEDVIASGGNALGRVLPEASTLDVSLTNRNRNPLYDRDVMQALGHRLLDTEGPWWAYYRKDDVASLLRSV